MPEQIVEIKPRRAKSVMGIFVQNESNHKAIYVRLFKKSIKVSDRKPAKYGLKSNAEVV